jgi:hypothetical protein
MNLVHPAQKSRRKRATRVAERSVRREPASANSLGRVVPAAWTAAGLASAASPRGKPAGAGCAPSASAGRSGSPGLLNVGRGAGRCILRRVPSAWMSASTLTPRDAGLDASKLPCWTELATHFHLRCLVTVLTDTCGDTCRIASRRSRLASPGCGVARFGSRGGRDA